MRSKKFRIFNSYPSPGINDMRLRHSLFPHYPLLKKLVHETIFRMNRLKSEPTQI